MVTIFYEFTNGGACQIFLSSNYRPLLLWLASQLTLKKKIDFADLAMHCLLTFGYMYFLLYFISFDLSVAKTLVHPCFRSKAPI